MDSINSRIAEELGVRPQQVEAAVALLDEGSTVPFIARYRKEVTGSLDDIQLRHLEERLRYLRELDERRISILASIQEQGKLTPQLERDIKLADTKTRLEDLYLPYKQKRRTKGQIALEAGLGELADGLFNDPTLTPDTEAARFVNAEKGVWDCTLVGYCSEVCPKGVDPAHAINQNKVNSTMDYFGVRRLLMPKGGD